MTLRRTIPGAIAIATLLACSDDPGAIKPAATTGTDGPAETTGAAASSTSVGGDTGDASDGTAADESSSTGASLLLDVGTHDEIPPGCSNGADAYVTLIDFDDASLHRFDPETLELQPLGIPSCPPELITIATTMDREGRVYLLMLDVEQTGLRSLYVVDPQTLDCQATPWADPEIEQEFPIYSLSFVADGPGAPTETLYVSGLDGPYGPPPADPNGVIGRIDLETFTTQQVATFDIDVTVAINEIRGTGAGRMYTLFYEPTTLADVDPTDGSIAAQVDVAVSTGSIWSFAPWAGKILLFTNTAPSSNSQLYTVDPVSGAAELTIEDVGFTVIGAASSTCAPYEPEG